MLTVLDAKGLAGVVVRVAGVGISRFISKPVVKAVAEAGFAAGRFGGSHSDAAAADGLGHLVETRDGDVIVSESFLRLRRGN